MRLCLFLAALAALFALAGFIGIAAGILALVFWALAVAFILLAWLAFRSRAKSAPPPSDRVP